MYFCMTWILTQSGPIATIFGADFTYGEMAITIFEPDVGAKLLHYVKKSTKWGDFIRFYVYICHVVDDFLILYLHH